MSVIFGPDVSQYQGAPAWATVKASGCVIKFWKETEGRTFVDPSAAHNRTPTPGMVEGCYHFLYYSDEYASNPALWGAQAEWFARNARGDVGHVLDVEAAATAGHHLGVKEWVAEYRKLFPGHPLGLYANLALWTNRSRMPYDPAGLFDYLWHAGTGNGYYTSATGSIAQQWAGTPKLTNSFAGRGFPDCRLWQITDHAQVPGVGGSFCDGNAFQGTAAELRALITTGETDMALDDATKAWLKSAEFTGAVADAIGGRTSFRDKDPYDPSKPLTVDRILNELLRRSDDPRDLTASGRDALAAQLGRVDADALAQVKTDIVNGVVAQIEAGVHVDPTDPQAIADLVGQQLDEHLSRLRIVTAQ